MENNQYQFLDEDGMNKLVAKVAQKISESYIPKSKYEADITELKERLNVLENPKQ